MDQAQALRVVLPDVRAEGDAVISSARIERESARESFLAVPETCHTVDATLRTAADAVKEQTTALRGALTEALARSSPLSPTTNNRKNQHHE